LELNKQTKGINEMAGTQDFLVQTEDFLGPQTLLASPVGSDQWDVADTSSTGTPTYTVGGVNGELTIAFDSANEIQNVCVFKSDVLNFDIDLLQSISFRLIGSNAILCETDDSVNDKDDVATGVSLSTTYKRFFIDFTGGKSNVKFLVDGQRVATSTVFDMSNFSTGLQPYIQLQKTASTNTDSVIVDYIEITSMRL